MERPSHPALIVEPYAWIWRLGLIGLFAWHGWMTLGLFGPERPWQRLLDEQPIVSGRHPLHLYHGYLGARTLYASGQTCCYDPAFQAGYPKTPVFDSGSRPAELFLFLAGGGYRPAAYKIGLALCCLLAPGLLVLACRGMGLRLAETCLATGMGLLIWWSEPGRAALEAGDLDVLLAALALVAHTGSLVYYHRAPGIGSWVGLLATAWLGWFAHPLLFGLALPLLLLYYFSTGARHPQLSWHLALLGSHLGALALNAYWLIDWVRYWWIRSPVPDTGELLNRLTLRAVWESELWGKPADRDLAWLLLVSAAVGILILHRTHQRMAARLLGLGTLGLTTLALLSVAWEPLGQLGTSVLLLPALWFAAPAAARAWMGLAGVVAHRAGGRARAVLVAGVLLLVAALLSQRLLTTLVTRCSGTAPLAVGLDPQCADLVEALNRHTTPEARILWEDRPVSRQASRWTALLPVLTGRMFVGGLDPAAEIEHAHTGLVREALAGQPIELLSDTALETYCRRYNVAWVVCWSPAAVQRLRAWAGAVEVTRVLDGAEGVLFRLDRPARSFALKGQARLVYADAQRITLADVVPEDGRVVLSWHYQSGLRASPTRVQVEREPDANDPIPLIRLRVAGPVARVTLTWEEP